MRLALPALIIAKGGSFSTVSTLRLFSSTSIACGFFHEKSHEESYDSSWDFGALEGTRIPGPLIKRIQGASFVKSQKCEEALVSSHYRKIHICTHRIICIQCNALQPLSSYSGVQKVCKNVQTGKTKPNGQINHRFYGRV